jgi:hypothetical protein
MSKSYTRSFAGGEISPKLLGRLDLAKFQTGLQRCVNFRVTPQGPVENRPGFEYVLKTKESTAAALIPFTYNSDQSFAIEAGAGYMRFHTQGATLLETAKTITGITQANPGVVTSAAHGIAEGKWVYLAGVVGMTQLNGRWAVATNVAANTFSLYDLFGNPINTSAMGAYVTGGTASAVYEIDTPYAAAHLFDIHYVQSADVLTLVHPSYKTRELRRLAATSWELSEVSFAPTIGTPEAPTLSTGGPGGGTGTAYFYATTAVARDTLEESLVSDAVGTILDLSVAGNYIGIQPAAVLGAVRYNVYKRENGIFGYIGQTDGSLFQDDNITPDMSKTPPLLADPFATGAISSIPVTAGGSLYNTVPLTGGAITTVTVTAAGTNYTSAPTATAAGGSGSGATFTVALGGGIITGVGMTTGGSGYTSPPTVTVTGSGGTGSGATFTAVLTGDAVTGITVNTAGSLYVAPTLSITGGGGTGATATAGASPCGPASVTITNGGTLYEAPTISFSGGGGSGATATATASAIASHVLSWTLNDAQGTGGEVQLVEQGGAITGVQVLAPGSGYVAPTITITDGVGGSGATFGTAVLTGEDVNPSAVSYFEQRRVFGGTTGKPQTVWLTRSGTESNMTYSIPTQDDDAITARLVSRRANHVRHLLPLGDLLALTSDGVSRIEPADGGALTPSSFKQRQQGYAGASNVQPAVSSQSVLYVSGRGAHIREVTYRWETQAYQSDDISVMAPHLFDYESVVQLAYAEAPVQTLWAVRGDGVLLGLTHVPEHEVKAWHQHNTQGTFESVCSIPEGDEDGVYVVVARTVGGNTVRYIERLHSRQFSQVRDAFFVDSGLSYSGAATTTVGGLHHLEGLQVSILADGGVSPPQTVEDGSITLDAGASVVQVGLSYTADFQTMPLSLEMAGFGQGATKNVTQVHLRLHQAGGTKTGPSFDKLTEYAQRTMADDYGTPPELVTGMISVRTSPSWQQDGSICVRQSDPLPITIESITLETASGG